jgi:hypothetical protein
VRRRENIEALPLEICGSVKEAVNVAEITALTQVQQGKDLDMTQKESRADSTKRTTISRKGENTITMIGKLHNTVYSSRGRDMPRKHGGTFVILILVD